MSFKADTSSVFPVLCVSPARFRSLEPLVAAATMLVRVNSQVSVQSAEPAVHVLGALAISPITVVCPSEHFNKALYVCNGND